MIKLTRDQQKAEDMLKKFLASEDSFASIVGSAGVGKLQPLSEPILTVRGWRPMGTIAPGDFVISEKGKPIVVEKTFPGKGLNIYKVTFTDGSFTHCCDEHLWQVHTSKMKLRGTNVVMSLKDMIKKGLKKTGRSGYRYAIPLALPVNVPEAQSVLPLDPYVLGYTLGNGHSPKKGRVEVTVGLEDHREIVPKLKSDVKLFKNKSICRVRLTLADTNAFNELGLHRKKSGDKFIPQDYLMSPTEEVRKSLLAGLMDSGGSCSANGNRVTYSSSSMQLAEEVVSLVRSLSGRGVLRQHVRRSGEIDYTVGVRLPFNPFTLKRKAARYSPLWAVNDKHIVSAEFIGIEDGQCLLVENPTHLYVTRDYTVTHNTFMMQRLPQLYEADKTLCTAPTNKAVKVLQQAIPTDIECVTIHKFLGLGVKNVKDKQVSYRTGTYDPTEWAHIRVVLVDEGSMLDSATKDADGKVIGKGLCGYIKEDAEEWDRKYIIMGDDCQLPPVEGDSQKTEAFDIAKPEHSVVMTEIVRQAASNPIIKAATFVRDAIKSGKEPKLKGGINEQEGTGVELLKRKQWESRLEEYVGDPRIHTDVDFCRVIAWTNNAVKNHNLLVRRMLSVDTSRPFDLGDTVVVNSAVEKGFTILLGTGVEVIIETMREAEHPYKGFKEWVVTLQGVGLTEPLRVLDESSRPEYAAALESLRKKCILSKQWQPFYGLKNYYADLRPPYAITAHKAQGSTFENVFVDLKDIYSNRNQGVADKCYYVAITRASRKVFVLV